MSKYKQTLIILLSIYFVTIIQITLFFHDIIIKRYPVILYNFNVLQESFILWGFFPLLPSLIILLISFKTKIKKYIANISIVLFLVLIWFFVIDKYIFHDRVTSWSTFSNVEFYRVLFNKTIYSIGVSSIIIFITNNRILKYDN